MNPLKLLQVKNMLNGFRSRHGKFVQFIDAFHKRGIEEGSVIELQIRTPDGKQYITNFKVLHEDIETLKQLHESMQ